MHQLRSVYSVLLLVCFSMYSCVINAQTIDTHSVLITAPAGYAERFRDVFEADGLVPVSVPMIETVIPEKPACVDSLLMQIDAYDFVAFSSRKAIESFALALDRQAIDPAAFASVGFCAIGKDAEYMQERLGLENAVQPDEPSPSGIAKALSRQPDIAGKRIAVLVPKVEKLKEPDVVPDFIRQLQDLELQVTRIDAYTTRPASPAALQTANQLIESGAVSCIAFTSSAEILVLLQNLQDRSRLDALTIACFGPYTAAFAEKQGLNVSIVARDFSSFSGFIHEIEQFYKSSQISVR